MGNSASSAHQFDNIVTAQRALTCWPWLRQHPLTGLSRLQSREMSFRTALGTAAVLGVEKDILKGSSIPRELAAPAVVI
jgi:hypothetical protein